MRTFYSLLLYLAMPAVLLYLFLRGLRSPGYLSRWSERFALFKPKPAGGGIVVHAVSMGEVNAASPLIQALMEAYPGLPISVTTFTPTGSDRVTELFGDRVFHVYSPFDLPGAVSRFFTRLDPRLVIVMETEIWPNLYHQAATRGIPLLIANARISDQSFDRYRRMRKLTGAALRQASHIAAQSETDAERLQQIGARPEQVSVTGNLKFDFSLTPELVDQGDGIRRSWGAHRPVLVAGSTHEDEEGILLQAFSSVLKAFPDALLVLVPRHPERFGRAAQAARSAGLAVSLKSEHADCPPQTQCYLIDAMGELLRYYAAGDVAFVGGTLQPVGGHNVLEPAALARPVLVGPYTANIADITRQLLEADAAVQVADGAALRSVIEALFADADRRDRMGRAANELVRQGQGAVKRTLTLAKSLLTEAAG